MTQTENLSAWIQLWICMAPSITGLLLLFFNLESLSLSRPQTHTYTHSVTVIVVVVFSSLLYFPKHLTVLQVCPSNILESSNEAQQLTLVSHLH